jgi:hypothetical protein
LVFLLATTAGLEEVDVDVDVDVEAEEVVRFFFGSVVRHGRGLTATQGGRRGRASQTSAERGGRGGSLRYCSSSSPKRSSSLM